jgi:hypothetical protein
MAQLKPFGALSREHLREAVTVYSVWWLEVYLAVVVLLRLGVARILDTVGFVDSTLPLPPVPHPYIFGAVQVAIALAWVYALTVTSRPLRAAVAWMAAGCFAGLAHTWYGFASALPNWHGLVGSAVFAGLVALRHTLQWRYGAASAGDAA